LKEIIHLIIEIITIDIPIGFGLYSILFFIFRYFSKQKKLLNDFDESACRLMEYAGIVFGVLWMAEILISYYELNNEIEKSAFQHRLFGVYWFGFWLQPLFWIFLTQLLRIKILRKSLIYRLVLSLLFYFTFERIVILTTSLHRDYLPDSWGLDISPSEIILGLTAKTILFILFVSIFHFGNRKLKTLYSTETKEKL